MTQDHDRDRIEPDESKEPEDPSASYPTMPPLDAAEPDLEQEGERPQSTDSGWAAAARAVEEGRTDDGSR